jgi:hypothetical protein
MIRAKNCAWAAAIVVLLAAPVFAQTPPPEPVEPISLAGPRFGFTMMSDGVVEKLASRSINVRPTVSQFGWQIEKRFSTGDGPTIVTEFVGLVGGLDQDVVLPSATWLIGIRTASGAEFGVGPNLTPAGTAMAIAAGVTFRSGNLNIPVNVAVVPSRSGMRVSMLTGFNIRRD